MQDQPTALELLAAVREFLHSDIIPALQEQRLRFRALVAANVLSIVERELPLEAAQLHEEWASLAALDGELPPPYAMPANLAELRADIRARNAALCARIRTGDADEGPWRAAVLAHVRRDVEQKLRVNNPKYLERVKG
jgi:hypothetical protein